MHTYPIHTTTTTNGIKVVVSPDPWVPGVALNLWYGVGSVHEQPGRTGLAHLFEHLMFCGSGSVGSGEHFGALQAIGGLANATTSFERTNYFETIPPGGLELALWLEADRLASLLDHVDQTNLDTQREVVKEEKRQRYDNQPYGDAFPALLAAIFPADYPYAHLPIGSMADLDAASLADVHAFFHHHYAPANLILTLCGALTPQAGFELVERYFADIAPGQATPAPPGTGLDRLSGVPRVDLAGDVPQDILYCAWLVPPVAHPASDALGLGLTTLAGSMTSRLHDQLVRTNLADSADAFDLGLQHGNSLVVASAACSEDVSPEQLEEAMMAVWDQFCRQGPTAEEVRRAQKAEDREYLADLASVENRADQLSAAWSLFDDPGEVNRHLGAIHALGPAEVAQACADWLGPDHRAVLTYRRSR